MRRLFLLLIGMIVAGCGSIPVSIDVGTIPPAATAVRATTASSSGVQQPAMPANLPRARIVKVVDGDTIDVQLNGQTVRLRLIGINTPESVDPRRPVECFGKQASDRAKQLLTGQTVLLENDPSQQDRDQYDRLLRYVWFPDGRFFNFEMVVQGYAYEYTYNVPYKYQSAFKKAQRYAERQQLGLWSPQTCSGQK